MHTPPEELPTDAPQTVPQVAPELSPRMIQSGRMRAWLILLLCLAAAFLIAWLLGFFNI
jgi:hypothetical protein